MLHDPNNRGTPSSSWSQDNKTDPHGDRYNCERSKLTLGQYSDDVLANGVFMNYDQKFDIAKAISGDPTYHAPIVWVTAAKDRIRWLSRSLQQSQNAQIDRETLGLIVDKVWNVAYESQQVPSTKFANEIIDGILEMLYQTPTKPQL